MVSGYGVELPRHHFGFMSSSAKPCCCSKDAESMPGSNEPWEPKCPGRATEPMHHWVADQFSEAIEKC
jgi:hypothetical protein